MTWGFSDRAATVAAGPAWLMWHFWWSSLNRGTGGGRGGREKEGLDLMRVG